LSIDRRVAAIAMVTSAVVMVPLVVLTEAPVPEETARRSASAVNDPEAVEALARLVERGRRGSWLVEYATERSPVGGETSAGRVIVASLPPSSVVTDGRTLTATIDGRSVTCVEPGEGPRCAEGAAPGGPDIREMLGGVTRRDLYAVTRSRRRSAGGEGSACFDLIATESNRVPGALIHEAELCYARDGILLAARVESGMTIDTRTALRVERDIGEDDLLGLVDEFGLPPSPGSG